MARPKKVTPEKKTVPEKMEVLPSVKEVALQKELAATTEALKMMTESAKDMKAIYEEEVELHSQTNMKLKKSSEFIEGLVKELDQVREMGGNDSLKFEQEVSDLQVKLNQMPDPRLTADLMEQTGVLRDLLKEAKNFVTRMPDSDLVERIDAVLK